MAVTKNTIFIIGAPRSGTTWLWGLLTSLENIIPLVREDFDPLNPSVIDNRRVTSETGAFVRYGDKYIKEIIHKKHAINPDKILVEKTPLHLLHIKRILTLFPDSKIIYMQRDPRAVISSMLHSEFFKFAVSLDDAIKKYRFYHDIVAPYIGDKRIFVIRYEDISMDTRKSFRDMCEFLKISVQEDAIDRSIRENDKKVKVDIKGVYRKGSIDSYKQDLSEENIRRIESELSDILLKQGYKS